MFNCFRPSKGAGDDDLLPQPARPRPSPKKTSTFLTLRRSGTDKSDHSTSSSRSNESISKLPPCKRRSDAEINALMMPVPHCERASKCLRLSHPDRYSDIVYEMKKFRGGSRNWKTFEVFDAVNDVDMNVSADEKARLNREYHARKMRKFESFDSETRRSIDDVDLIG